jgi:indolepyruvate ferredoxin oxidoreductase
MKLANVGLDDKYAKIRGRVFMTGIQALVRLPLDQSRRDQAAGHDTAAYITGYRGSPLGGYDQQLTRAERFLSDHRVVFQPGVNEDLAATAVWGTQQAELDGEGRHQGVFALWYGKGPGVDRSGDVLRHGNLAGSSPLGGVLVAMGDDHACESSTTAHQSEYALVDAMIPILNPAGVQEILDYGLLGWALSRYSGCWVGLKCVHDTVEAAASVEVGAERLDIRFPDPDPRPAGGLNIRWPDTPLEQEARLHEHKLAAARAFARANRLDRVVLGGPGADLGIVTTGKSYLDVRQSLADLGVDAAEAERLGVSVYKVAMPWPLEPEGLREFTRGLAHILVVEEKRGLMEEQIKSLLYGTPNPPTVTGKRDARGDSLLPSTARLDGNRIGLAIGRQLLELRDDRALRDRVAELAARYTDATTLPPSPMARTPYFCAGCPHNTSTLLPEGSHGYAGIGCHWMAQMMDRGVQRYTHMGGEGANWVGEGRFSRRRHVFQNIGDGTYFHSGLLAIRSAVASGVNITFKILYNDAVAMTGGQKPDGPLSVPQITRQVASEGAVRVMVVTDEPDKYPAGTAWAPGAEIHHRDRLDQVQRTLREVPGTSVLVYDQTCAAEKRRRRKRGLYPDPDRRIFINQAVCEGCGDCGVQSNCVAILPAETPLGRKRVIDQSACNKDESCLKGFCPSFVTVHGGRLRKRGGRSDVSTQPFPVPPDPVPPDLDGTYRIVLAGVGGTGVITVGALLGMAAHLEGKGCSVLDMTGLAQKGGAVASHIVLGDRPEDVTATHVPPAGADLLLGCDLVVAAGDRALPTLNPARSHAVINDHQMMTGAFTHQPDAQFPDAALTARVEARCRPGDTHGIAATRLAEALLGDAIGANTLMLGFAYQKGLLPVSATAIDRAIELNGQAVEMNKQAFEWGRRLAAEPERVARVALGPPTKDVSGPPRDLDALVEARAHHLVDYQDEAYAQRYRSTVEAVRRRESEAMPGQSALTAAVAESLFRLMAYKDEYEVARLFSDGTFRASLDETFDGDVALELHLAPPFLSRPDPATGRPRKRRFGPWILRVMPWLARMKRLRGTAWDPFGYSADRRLERRLAEDYRAVVDRLLPGLTPDHHAAAVEIARLAQEIRGFGPVKLAAAESVRGRQQALLAEFESGRAASRAA